MVHFCWRDIAELDIGAQAEPNIASQFRLTKSFWCGEGRAPAVSHKPGVTVTTAPCAMECYWSLGQWCDSGHSENAQQIIGLML